MSANQPSVFSRLTLPARWSEASANSGARPLRVSRSVRNVVWRIGRSSPPTRSVVGIRLCQRYSRLNSTLSQLGRYHAES